MIDVEKLKRWNEAANSKSMHPEDVAAARFQLGQFAKGPEFAAILALAEREQQQREENLALAREISELRSDLAVMREHDCTEVKRMREALERIALSGDGEDVFERSTLYGTFQTIARNALGEEKA